MPTRLGQVLRWSALLLSFHIDLAIGANEQLPAWLNRTIAKLQASQSRDVIEEATYQGNRVFEFISGDRFDTGDEHALFGDNGKEVCKFGGYVGHVTSGSCDIGKIIYVRKIFPAQPPHSN